MLRSRSVTILLCSGLALPLGCSAPTKASSKPAPKAPAGAAAEEVRAAKVTTEALMGRWILSPGDCHLPASEASTEEGPLVSPAGAVLTLGAGGGMTSRQGDFVRRGTWKFEGGTLRLAVEPPPRRLDMGFVPVLEPDRLVLQGAEEMVLVYHRDPFVGVEHAP